MGIIAGLLSMFGWGIADFLGAVSSRKIGYFLTFFWMQVAGFLVALIYLFTNPSIYFGDISKFILIFIVVGFINAVSSLFFYSGLQFGQVSLVSPLGNSWALVTVVLGVIFLKETLLISQILAIILITLGIILTSINKKELLETRKLTIFKGAKEGIITMFSWGILYFLITTPLRVLGWFLSVLMLKFFTILFLVIISFFAKHSLRKNLKPHFFLPILIIGFLDVGSWFTYNLGIKVEQVSIIAPIVGSLPVVTIFLARIFLKEKLVLNQVIGIIGIIAGLVLISIK